MTDFPDIVDPKKVESLLRLHLKNNGLLSDDPQAWTIGHSPLGGRGMFATRDIRQGELIFVDSPLLIGPRCYKKYLPLCVNCYKNNCPLFPCDRGCGLPVCSSECENSPRHAKYECEYLRSRRPNCGSMWSMELLLALTPIRALSLNNEQRELLAALQCHSDVLQSYEVELLQRNVTNPPTPEDIELIKRVSGVFNTNSFETVAVHSKDCQSSLRALYPMGSLQNHSCVPKTRHHFDSEQRLYVLAALPIARGEEITMTYTDSIWDTTMRRQFLRTTKHFSCECERCRDPSEFGSRLGALLCASPNCFGNLLPCDPLDLNSPWLCDKCPMTVTGRQIQSIRSGLAAIVREVSGKKPRHIAKFIKRELSVIVPLTNYLMMDVKFQIVSYFGRSDGVRWSELTDDELALKCAYCNDLLAVLDVLGYGDCNKKGLLLYELYCSNVERFRRLRRRQETGSCNYYAIEIEENERLLKEAKNILQNDIVAFTLMKNDENDHRTADMCFKDNSIA